MITGKSFELILLIFEIVVHVFTVVYVFTHLWDDRVCLNGIKVFALLIILGIFTDLHPSAFY